MAEVPLTVDQEIASLLDQLAVKEGAARVARAKLTALLEAATVHNLRDPNAETASPTKTRAVPTEWMKNLVTSRDRLVQLRLETKEKVKSKNTKAVQLEKVRNATKALLAELDKIQAATGQIDPDTARHFRSNAQKVSDVVAIKRDMTSAVSRQASLKEQLLQQASDLAVLIERNTALDDIEQQLFMMEGERGIKERELASVLDEVKSLKKIFDRKQGLLSKMLKADDSKDLLLLEGDKRIAQQRLQKHEKFIRDNGVSAQHRAMQIYKLERKINLLGSVLRDVLIERGAINADEDPDEYVEAAALDEVHKEIQVTASQVQLHEEQLALFDAQVENAENRVRILCHATASVTADADRTEKESRSQLRRLDAEQKSQESAAEVMVLRQEHMRVAKEAELAELRNAPLKA